MYYQQIIQNCFLEKVGASGVSHQAVAQHQKDLVPAIEWLNSVRDTGQLPLIDNTGITNNSKEVQPVIEYIRSYKHLVVLGTGGSSLGGQFLVSAFTEPFKNPATNIHFIDNNDPHTLDALTTNLPLEDSFFLIVSKSGATAETLLQTSLVLDALLRCRGPQSPAKQMLCITVPESNPLRQLALKHKFATLDHDPALGGRFSVLSLVGLIPCAVAGADVSLICKGAQSVLADLWSLGEESQVAIGASLQYSMIAAGKNINVMMPYCDRLRLFGAWYKQVWDESLGKNGKGSTAINAIGSVDQHSQLQLFLEGPRDKLINFIFVDHKDKGQPIPDVGFDASQRFMQGKKTGDLIAAQQRATMETLVKKGVPVRVFSIEAPTPEAIGALLMHSMLETILVADLLGVNAFDQPAVEEGKVLAREYMLKG